MKELNRILIEILKQNGKEDMISKIDSENNIYPFGRVNRLMAYLLGLNMISYEEYDQLGKDYANRNKYLELFDLAPRTFGQTWGETHIRELFPEFRPATKENLGKVCPDFDGEFDAWLDGIRIEIKACRASNPRGQGSLASRAYLHNEARKNNFKYHYQQLKPSCCDVYIWIGVCRDELLYWILTSDELLKTNKMSSQHRNEHTGTDASIFEGQVFMTEEELQPFKVNEADILRVVKEKGKQ